MENNWFRIALSCDDVAEGEFDNLVKWFHDRSMNFESAVAVFSADSADEPGAVDVFLSPACSGYLGTTLLQECRATSAPKPSRSGLSLLFGEDAAWALLNEKT